MGVNVQNSPFVVTHAPITTYPFRFPETQFSKAIKLSKAFNTLVDNVSLDSQWLHETLQLTAENDHFTGMLVQIHKIIQIERITQPIRLGINRSDYMQHEVLNDPRSLLQVEINTIASSFAGLSTKISELFSSNSYNRDANIKIPENNALQNISKGISLAHNLFLSTTLSTSAIILMVVQGCERNFADQRLLQFEIQEQHNLKVIRATLAEIHLKSILEPGTNHLLYDGQLVSVVYFRAGYTPNDYTHPESSSDPSYLLTHSPEWAARLLVERASAVKCPNVAYQLAGTKKVQQALAAPGMLERFLPDDSDTASELRSVFAGLYSLDAAAGTDKSNSEQENELRALIERVVSHPEQFVMKPQREGGGNNFYGEEMVAQLRSLEKTQLAAFILMERIQPPPQLAECLRDGVAVQRSCLCELGIFGVFVAHNSSGVHWNEYGGYLLRVKPAESDEGGVAAGYAVLSCPALV